MYLFETVGPDDEATRAIIATFRPFIQQRPISFKHIASLCDDPDISTNWKTQVTNIRSSVNSFLDAHPNNIEGQGEPIPTRWVILDVFIYGHILHVDDKKKRELYENWQSQEFYFLLLVTELNTILVNLCRAIFQIAAITRAELAE